MTIIGIDPGKSGGIAWILHDGMPCAIKMPETEADLWTELVHIKGGIEYQSVAYIEHVHSSPQMGVKSAFTFGQGFGTLLGMLTALEVPFELVRPQKWQRALGCLSKGQKNVTKRKAQQLFPSLKITHAIADALLIAEFGRRIRQPVHA